MSNALLDFVMALVRDPAASARYAADPAGVLADADLPGVTIADVNSLIPVVTDSLAAATPAFGPAADQANVWTSGAAAAAFDAFEIGVTIHAEPPSELLQPLQPTVLPPMAHTDLRPAGTVIDPAYSAAGPDGSPALPAVDPITLDRADEATGHGPQADLQIEHHPGDPSGLDPF